MPTRPSPRSERLGTPKIPQSVSRGARFRGFTGSRLLRPVRLLAPLDGSDRVSPATGGFYIQASDGLVALPVTGYHYNSDWTPLLAGLSPAGMAASLAAPDPSEPNSGTRLPPWVSDGETFARPGVKEVRSGEPGIGQLRHPRPCEPVFLAAPAQRAPPQVGHMVAEGHEGTAVRWHRMISKVAADHLPQPAPLDGDRLMHTPPQRVLDPPQGRPHAVGTTLPLELEGAPAGSPADVGEPQEAERLRFAEPALGAPARREAAKRDQAGLVRMQRQRKLLQARAHRVPEALGIGLVLETDHDIIRVTDDHHVPAGLPPSPALGPEVEHVVQVDVGQERRDHRSLPCPRLTDAHDPVFQDPRPEPFPDQADDARVADPVVQETDKPFLAHRVEERPDVGVQDVAHLGAGDPDRERIERVVRPAPGPEAIREPEEVLLVDRVQHRRRGPLDDLVLQRRNGQRALAAVRLGDEPAAGGQRPVRATVDPLVQALDPAIEVFFVGLPCQPVHAGGGLPLEGGEGRPEPVGGDMVEERGEPFLLSLPCNVPYAVQPL